MGHSQHVSSRTTTRFRWEDCSEAAAAAAARANGSSQTPPDTPLASGAARVHLLPRPFRLPWLQLGLPTQLPDSVSSSPSALLTPYPTRGSGDAGVGGLAAVRLP